MGLAIKDQDKNLTSLLKRCEEKSIRLSKEKVVLEVQQVDFMGNYLTAQDLRPNPSKVEAILKMESTRTKAGH